MDNNRIGRRNSGTTEGDTAGVGGVIPDGNSLITFPTHNVRLDLSDDTVQHTVVDVVHFSTCYYHVVEVTRIYFVWTETSQAASSVSLIKGAKWKHTVPVTTPLCVARILYYSSCFRFMGTLNLNF